MLYLNKIESLRVLGAPRAPRSSLAYDEWDLPPTNPRCYPINKAINLKLISKVDCVKLICVKLISKVNCDRKVQNINSKMFCFKPIFHFTAQQIFILLVAAQFLAVGAAYQLRYLLYFVF